MKTNRRAIILGAVVAAIFVVAPFVLDRYTVSLMLSFFGYSIALLGLNLLFGYTGLLSFGHAAFLGAGAYTAAVLTSKFGIRDFELILVASIVVSAVLAIPIGYICVRHTRIFFGMLTLAFGMLFHSFLFKFYGLTGGDEGILVRRPRILGMEFASLDKVQFLTGPFYFYALTLSILLGFAMWRLVNSPFGLQLRAIRDNERKAEYVGVPLISSRLIAFVVSGVYGAIGGAILAINTGLADPELVYWTQSGNLVFMTVLGGFGSFAGPPIGAFVFIFLQDALMSHTQYWRFVLGAILALVVVAFPKGIAGLVQLFPERIRVPLQSKEVAI